MGDGFLGLLPYLPNVPFGIAVVFFFRLWLATDRQLRAKQDQYAAAQEAVDEERASRRTVENKMNHLEDRLTAEIRALKVEVSRLRAQLGQDPQ